MNTTATTEGRAAEATPTIRIQPTRGWANLGLGELWQYRELLWFLTMRDIKARYRQMALGPLWILIQPIIDMVVFTIIFGKLARLSSDGVPYQLFVYTALLPWGYFAQAANASVNSLVAAMPVISKVYFPRLVIPFSAVIAGLVDLGARMIVLVGMMAYYVARGEVVIQGWELLMIPVFVLLAMATALAVGLWGATLAVRYRDLRFAVRNGLEVWKFATPVVYTAGAVADRIPHLFWIYKLNPMFWVIEGFRWSVYGKGTAPGILMLASAAIVLVLLLSGMMIFRRTERTIVDLL